MDGSFVAWWDSENAACIMVATVMFCGVATYFSYIEAFSVYESRGRCMKVLTGIETTAAGVMGEFVVCWMSIRIEKMHTHWYAILHCILGFIISFAATISLLSASPP